MNSKFINSPFNKKPKSGALTLKQIHLNAKRRRKTHEPVLDSVNKILMPIVKKSYTTTKQNYKDHRGYEAFKQLLHDRGIINNTLNPNLLDTTASDALKLRGLELALLYSSTMRVESTDVHERLTEDKMAETDTEDVSMDVEEDEGESNAHDLLIAARRADIPSAELDTIKAILKGPNNNDVIIDKFSIDMTRAKLICLKPSTWLNDEVINFYMNMLQERDLGLTEKAGGEVNRKSSHYFSSFFIDRLVADGKYNYKNVQRWSRKFDVFSKDKIFMPINLSQTHWVMAVAFVQKKEIHYFDSMSGSGKRFLPHILQWFVDEAKDKKKGSIVVNPEEWKLIDQEDDVPQQRNGVDCGVFSTICADFLSDDLPLKYSQEEMGDYRQKIGAAIVRGVISY
jgi:sentrin-specific protease 1